MTVLIAIMGETKAVDVWLSHQPRDHWKHYRPIHKTSDAIGLQFDAVRIIDGLVPIELQDYVNSHLSV